MLALRCAGSARDVHEQRVPAVEEGKTMKMTEGSGGKSHPITNGEAVVWVIIAVFAIGTGMAGYALHRVEHYAVIGLAVIGAVAVVLALLAWKVYRILQRRARADIAAAIAAQPSRQPIAQPSRQAVDGGQHVHLQIPASWTPDDARRFLGK